MEVCLLGTMSGRSTNSFPNGYTHTHTCISALEWSVGLWESHLEGTGGWCGSEGTLFKPYSVLLYFIPRVITTYCAQASSGIEMLVLLLGVRCEHRCRLTGPVPQQNQHSLPHT